MKAIVSLTEKEFVTYSAIYKNLKVKTKGIKIFESLIRKSRYACYSFSGVLSNELILALDRMPTSTEVIMLVDGGFSHFGASCLVMPDNSFNGKVYTD